MAITARAGTAAGFTATAGASLSIPHPTSPANGDLLVIWCYSRGPAVSFSSGTAPADWTRVNGGSGTYGSWAIFARIWSTGDSTANVTVTTNIAGFNDTSGGRMFAFTGAVSTSVAGAIDVTPTAQTFPTTGSTPQTLTHTGITTQTNSAAVVLFGGKQDGTTSTNQWSGWATGFNTEIADNNSPTGGDVGYGAAWGTKAAAGATGNLTATIATAPLGSPDNGSTLVAMAIKAGSVQLGLSETVTATDDALGLFGQTDRPTISALSADTILQGESFLVSGNSAGAKITETAAASDALRLGGALAGRGQSDSATPADGYRTRGLGAAEASDSAEAQDDYGVDSASRPTAMPYISLSASEITVGDSFLVNGTNVLERVSETVTASDQLASEYARPGRGLSESATAEEETRHGAVAWTGISESATATDGAIYQSAQTPAPVIFLPTSTITAGDSFTVGGGEADTWVVEETVTASDGLAATQGFATSLSESVTTSDGYGKGTQELSSAPTITSLSTSEITQGDSFLVNGTTRQTDAPSITSLSADTITVGQSFLVNGSPQTGLERQYEWVTASDQLAASQGFATSLEESAEATERLLYPAGALTIPSTLEAWEASDLTGTADGADALLEVGQYVEWTVDAGGGGLFTLLSYATSMEGAKITVSIDDIDQGVTVIPSEEEEEESERRY